MLFIEIVVVFYSKCLFILLNLALLKQINALNSLILKFYFFLISLSNFAFARFKAHVPLFNPKVCFRKWYFKYLFHSKTLAFASQIVF